jgi:hypothetical protein
MVPCLLDLGAFKGTLLLPVRERIRVNLTPVIRNPCASVSGAAGGGLWSRFLKA